jgi:hypothetical protein
MSGMAGMSVASAAPPGTTALDGASVHHIEAHVYDLATGAPEADVMPFIAMTDQATGITTQLAPVMAMYGVAEGLDDLHYGNNALLPPSIYTFVIIVDNDLAVFPDVVVH